MCTDYVHPPSASTLLWTQAPVPSQLLGVAKVLLEVTSFSATTHAVVGCSPDQLTPYASWETQPSPIPPLSSKLSGIGSMILLHILMGLPCSAVGLSLGPGTPETPVDGP